ncbi:MAG: H-NS histone family protein [Pseudomonadota bacterium]
MATKKLDLTKLSLDELKSLSKDVDRAIGDFQKRKRSEAMKEIQAVAKKHGLSVEDIVGGKAKGKKGRTPAKYRNPDDQSQEWSGRGRQPAWFKAAVSAGKAPETLEI